MTNRDHGSTHGHGVAPFKHLAGTVLIVDDDRDLLDGLARGLRHSAFRLLTATSSEEALALVGREQVDVVVSDLKMPAMDGLELLDRVHDRRPEAVRILMTGFPSAESAIEAINHGEVFRYLTKPVSRDLLEATLTIAFARLAEERARDAQAAAAAEAAQAPPPPPRPTMHVGLVLTDEERLALRQASGGIVSSGSGLGTWRRG